MPKYTYGCGKCGFRKEYLYQYEDEDYSKDPKCPYCSIDMVRVFKNSGCIIVKELVHTDSGIPQSVHNHLVNKPRPLYDRALARQGKPLDPEDM